ncbi:MAG TPA: YbjN domain-containing protein [Allosphingosinicella sp.]|nr:YbjN domain-containing protein [Allosphingosinicella sp.]
MKPAIAAAAAFALIGSSAGGAAPPWNAKAPENNEVFPAFTSDSVESVLTAIGARYQRSGTAAKPTLLVTFANNRKAVLSLGGCAGAVPACKSLSMQSNWTRIANSTPARTASAIQRFNQRYSFGKAFVTADGQPGMQHYLTADYGYIRGNLAVNLLVFATQVDRFARQVLGPLEAKR